jgi:hypothetical protein
MMFSKATTAFGAALFLCAAGLFAQDAAKPPAEVDAALRQRAAEFFQYHVDGQYRKAEQLVAEESKDTYYNSDKPRYVRFTLDSVEYLDNFTRAKVRTTVGFTLSVPVEGLMGKLVDVPITTDWKLDGGKWCWYSVPQTKLATPWGEMTLVPKAPGAPPSLNGSSASAPVIPSTPDFAMGKTKFEQQSLSLKPGGSAALTALNSAQGFAGLTVTGKPDGITLTPDSLNVPPAGKATFTVKAAAGAKSGQIRFETSPSSEILTVQITVE